MSININITDVYKPSIEFSISGTGVADYVLSWNGRVSTSDGSKTFSSLEVGSKAAAKTVPVNTSITFTPTLNLPLNNKIIQYKWSFGDGEEKIVYSGSPVAITHIYDSGLAPAVGNNCLTATLTVIDKYQQHARAYKQIYLKQ